MVTKKPANGRLEEELHFSEQKISGLEASFPAISFDDAWQRELEYSNRVKTRSLDPSNCSGSLPASMQELPTKTNAYGTKRKETFPSPPSKKLASSSCSQPPVEGCHNRYMPPKHLQSEQERNPKLQLSTKRETSAGEFRLQQHLTKQTTNLQPSSSQMSLIRCHTCGVSCMNAFSYEQHCLGKKHKAKLEEVFGDKQLIEMKKHQLLWCKECNVPCVNELALGQHLSRKKHALRLFELQPLCIQYKSSPN